MHDSSRRISAQICKKSSTEVRLTSATESCSKTFNATNKIVKEWNLDHCESDNSESWSRELFPVLQVVKEVVEVDQIILQRQNC